MTTDDELEYVKVIIETRWYCNNSDCDEENESSNFAGEELEWADQDEIVVCKLCGTKYRAML